jgi:shikimate dehydrogenase
MGWPIGHSKSPALHGYWLRELGIDGAYVPLAVEPGNLATALRALPALGFVGVNLTVPHKEEALRIVDDVDVIARQIGAANTIVVARDGTLRATNTDAYGFISNLRHNAPSFSAGAMPAAVLGAGGAARAVCAALIDAGCHEIRLMNRNRARAEILASTFGKAIRVMDWHGRSQHLAGAGLLVNTTTLGMSGQPALDIQLEALRDDAVVSDIVYAPLETPLLTTARSRGLHAVDGLGMLLYQAQPAFAAWFGKTPEVTPALRAHVLGQT